MIYPTIKDYHDNRRRHFISPITDHPDFLGKSALDLRWGSKKDKKNLLNQDDLFKMEVALPGFEKEDIEVFVQDNILLIRAERKNEVITSSKYLINEVDTDIVIKRFQLGNNIGHEKVTAFYEKGILNLTFTDVPENREYPYKNVEILD